MSLMSSVRRERRSEGVKSSLLLEVWSVRSAVVQRVLGRYHRFPRLAYSRGSEEGEAGFVLAGVEVRAEMKRISYPL